MRLIIIAAVTVFTSDITEYTVRDDGIVIGREINLDVPRTAESIAQSFDRLAEFLQGKRPPGIWDARSVPNFPLNVWQVFVSRVDSVVVALAILVDEAGEKTMGGFPDAISSMLIPVRLFRDEEGAIEWLRQFIDEDAEPGS